MNRAMSHSRHPRPDAPARDVAAPQAEHFRRWMHEGLHDLPHASTVLAVGSGQAFLTPQLAEYSNDVTVLDTSAAELAQLARRFPEISFLPHEPANPLPFAHHTFDAIWCCELLDRVFDPLATLREMHRVLVPGGRLLVTVPDHGPVRNVLIALFHWEEHFAPSNPRIRHFTRHTLVRLAREAGFGEIHATTGGAARRIAGALVPRSLMLRARKGPGVEPAPVDARGRGEEAERELGDALAFATRMRDG